MIRQLGEGRSALNFFAAVRSAMKRMIAARPFGRNGGNAARRIAMAASLPAPLSARRARFQAGQWLPGSIRPAWW
jgi:hypothetical protein